MYRLNGTSPPIHEVNSKAPIRLHEGNLIDYLEFFCFFVRGEKGPFLIAQSVGDTYVPKRVDEATAAVLEENLRPVEYEGLDEQGRHICEATIYYSNAVFHAAVRGSADRDG